MRVEKKNITGFENKHKYTTHTSLHLHTPLTLEEKERTFSSDKYIYTVV